MPFFVLHLYSELVIGCFFLRASLVFIIYMCICINAYGMLTLTPKHITCSEIIFALK